MSQDKPHLIRATIGKHGLYWHIDCPYDAEDETKPCQLWAECDHSRPEAPDNGTDEPTYRPTTTDGPFELNWDGYSDEQRKEWEAYLEAEDSWGESHPHGAWDRTPGCWAAEYMGSMAPFEECLAELPEEVEMTLPFPVSVDAEGHMDDAMLILRPWVLPETQHQDA